MEEQHSDSSSYFPVEYEEEVALPPAKRQRFSRPKVCDSSFWSNENIKKLITAVRPLTAIWQADSEGFRSRSQREAAWQKVFEAFGNEIIDTNQLVAKWQNLRTQYRAVRATVKKQSQKRPSWRFYKNMKFIDHGLQNEENADAEAEQHAEEHAEIKRLNIPQFAEPIWDDESVLKLINAVKDRKTIWQHKREHYKQRNTRESDWLSIANDDFEKKIPVNKLVAKWQNLRTSYRSAKNLQKPSWKYFAYMTFLDEKEEPLEVQHSEVLEAVEELEYIESIATSENYALNDVGNDDLIQSDYEDNAIKEEHVQEHEESIEERGESSHDPLQKRETDNIGVFVNFLTSELRKIKTAAHLEVTKRKILQIVWQCIDDEPTNP